MQLQALAAELSIQDAPALLLLFVAGAVASAINAVAGGGSLISFPALIAVGIPPLFANATNAVALWPGSFAGALGFRNLLAKAGHHLRVLVLPTAAGSLLGALLLVSTPERAFRVLVPVLVLVATVLLALQPQIRRFSLAHARRSPLLVGVTLQFLVSVYGGYFGAGMGILMLAVFGLFVEGTLHELNAIKAWLGLLVNLTASVLFVIQGMVRFAPALSVMAGAVLGGYAAARLSQKVDPERLRKATVVFGAAVTAWFAWRLFRG